MFGDEGVVVQLGTGGVHPVDLLGLAGAQPFVRIDAPDAVEQALAAQHLVAAGDAAPEIVGGVEEGGVAVGDLAGEGEDAGVDRIVFDGAVKAIQQRDGAFDPDTPMAEQAATDPHPHLLATAADDDRRDQIEHDGVVVAGVERDTVLRTGGDHPPDDVQRMVAVERRHLDRDDVVDPGETAPERGRQADAADRGLQVEADQRHLLRHPAAVGDDGVLVLSTEGGEAQQHGVVAQIAGDLRLPHRLCGPPDGAGNPDQRPVRPGVGGLGGEREDRLEQARLADRELGGVDPDRDPARAGVDVVPGERPLAPRIQRALRRQGERMRGDDRAAAQDVEDLGRQLAVVQAHGRYIRWIAAPGK